MVKRLFQNKQFIFGLVLFLLLVFISFVGPLFYRVDPFEMNVVDRVTSPSQNYLFGTDEFGRDLLSRIIHGGRISLSIGLIVSFLSSLIGVILGMYSAFYPQLGNIIMRAADGMMAIPGLLLAIALMSIFGPAASNIVIALTIVYVPVMARVTRSSALNIIVQPYISATRIMGASDGRLIWLHIFPNVVPIMLIQASFIFAGTIISEAALSYLGAGIPAPAPSWGNIIQGGKVVIFNGWWIVLFASIAIVISVISLNLISEGIRKTLSQVN